MHPNKKLRFNWGIFLVLVLSVIPMFAWKIGTPFPYDETWQNIAFSFAKIGAFGGLAMFALSLILSGRYSWYDKLFGGLDKMYIAHRFLGTFSLILLFIHPFSLTVLRFEAGAAEGLRLWFDVSDFGIWIGSMALYALFALIIWSVFSRAKYETFIKVHRLLGLVFIAGVAHAFLAGSILASNQFMFWYFAILCSAAIFTYVVYSIFGDLVHRPIKYRLVRVSPQSEGIIELHLEPTSRIINFAPGQFVYIAFEELGDHGYHPFSISSNRKVATLTLAVRESGDFTKELKQLQSGTIAKIKGPYGGFTLELNSRRKQLWIAGGIGVTPFLSGAASMRNSTRVMGGDVEMIYATDDSRPYGLELLQDVEERNDIFNVTLFDKETFGHVSFESLQAQMKDLAEREIYICGPPVMIKSLQSEAEKLGFANRLHFEEFSY